MKHGIRKEIWRQAKAFCHGSGGKSTLDVDWKD
jgi:hypothetical protein